MKFTTKSGPLESLKTQCLIIAAHEDGKLSAHGEALNKASDGHIARILKGGDLSGKPGSHLLLHAVPGVKAERVLLVGSGKAEKLARARLVNLLRTARKLLDQYNLKEACLALDLELDGVSSERLAWLTGQIFEAGSYRYTTTHSKTKPASRLTSLQFHLSDSKQQAAAKKGLDTGAAIGRGMMVAKELGNLPGNICTPSYLAEQAVKLGKTNSKLKVTVLSEAQMKRLGMGSLLSVGNGSAEPSKLIVMEYKGGTAREKPHVIVGKGITFDTGGISLKPGSGMDEMKFDMCGAASVMGTMHTLCELQPKRNVVAVIAAAENMPSSTATKPGDIVTSMSGQTIEILNTDAEGRLVLCDALTYVERYKPASVIDIATLTGAIIVALGAHTTGMMSNDDELAAQIQQCSQDAHDPVWRLPMGEEYQRQLDSNFADIANIGGPKAGSITAACFLSRFTEKYKWAHLDIAGTAWTQGKEKGATGRPVPLLVEYLLSR